MSRVRVSFTVDVDLDKWAAEFGLDKSEVRADVNAHAFNATYCYIQEQRLAPDGAS